jgi:hypothetical protein
MNRFAVLACVAGLAATSAGLSGPAAAQGFRARPAPRAPEAPREVYVPVNRVLLAGAAASVPVDPRRTLESVAIDWVERSPGSRVAVLLDGRLVAHRFVGGRERESVAVGRRGAQVGLQAERGRVLVRGVHVRYAAEQALPVPPRLLLRDGPLSRRAVFDREVRGFERLVIPGEGTGLFVDEVRVRATGPAFGGRLRLEVPGMRPQERLVTGVEVLRFELPRGVRADADLFLASDPRGVRVDQVRILLERRPGGRDGRGRGHDDGDWREGRRGDRDDDDDDGYDDDGRRRGRGRGRD